MVKDIKSVRKQWKHLFFFSDITCLHQLQVHFKGPTWCKFPSSDVTHSSLSANSSQMWKVPPLLFPTYSPSRKCFLKHTVLDFIPLWCHWCHSQVTDTLPTETLSDGRLCFCLVPNMAGPIPKVALLASNLNIWKWLCMGPLIVLCRNQHIGIYKACTPSSFLSHGLISSWLQTLWWWRKIDRWLTNKSSH